MEVYTLYTSHPKLSYNSFPSCVATKKLLVNPFDEAIFSSSFSKKGSKTFPLVGFLCGNSVINSKMINQNHMTY